MTEETAVQTIENPQGAEKEKGASGTEKALDVIANEYDYGDVARESSLDSADAGGEEENDDGSQSEKVEEKEDGSQSEKTKEKKTAGKKKQSDSSSEEPNVESKDADEKKLPAKLLTRAVESGLTIEDAERIGEEALKRVLGVVDSVRQVTETEKVSGQKPDVETVGKKEDETKPATDEPKVQLEALMEKLKLDDGFDPEVRGAHDALGKWAGDVAQRLERMEGLLEKTDLSVQEVTQRLHAQGASDAMNRLDSYFSGLGEGFEAVFGKGPQRGMNPDSKESENRDEVIAFMGALIAGYQVNKTEMPPQDKMHQQAVNALFPEAQKEIEQKAISLKLKTNVGGRVGKPGRKRGKEKSKSKNELLEDNIQEILNQDVEMDDESESTYNPLDGFPD